MLSGSQGGTKNCSSRKTVKLSSSPTLDNTWGHDKELTFWILLTCPYSPRSFSSRLPTVTCWKSLQNNSENESHHLARCDQHPSARPHVHHKVREVELDSNPTLRHPYLLLDLAQKSGDFLLSMISTVQYEAPNLALVSYGLLNCSIDTISHCSVLDFLALFLPWISW